MNCRICSSGNSGDSLLRLATIVWLLAAPGVVRGDLLVASSTTRQVFRFSDTGVPLGAFVATGAGGVNSPANPRFGPDRNLYLIDQQSKNILRYNGNTGAFIDVFVAGGALTSPSDFTFGPDGNLYIGDNAATKVIRKFNGTTGASIGVFTSGATMSTVQSPIFGPDGHLYVSDSVNVLKFHGSTGTFISNFVPAGRGGMSAPTLMIFGPNGNLYVATPFGGILRFNGTTGDFLSQFAPHIGPRSDYGLAFGPDGNLYVGYSTGALNSDFARRYNGQTGVLIDTVIQPGTVPNINGFSFMPAKPQKQLLFATSPDRLHIVDALTYQLVRSVTIQSGGVDPYGVAATPDGKRAFVAIANLNNVTVVETATGAVVATIPVVGAVYPVMSPDGRRLYVAAASRVAVIDTGTLSEVATIPVAGAGASGITPDGRFLYASGGGSLKVIDLATSLTVATIPLPGASGDIRRVTFKPDGQRAYAIGPSVGVVVVDTSARQVVTTISGLSSPVSAAVGANGTKLYVSNSVGGSITTIDTATNSVGTSIAVGGFLQGITASVNGQSVFVADTSGSVKEISTSSNSIKGSISLSRPAFVATALASADLEYPMAILADRPVAYFRLGEAPGSTLARDASGNAYNGTYARTPGLGVAGLAAPSTDTAVRFGSGDVEIPNIVALNFVSSPFTIEAWFNGTLSNQSSRLFDKSLAGASSGYGLDVSASGVRLLGCTNLQAALALSSNTTYHVVAVSNGSGTGWIYVNGVLAGSGAYSACSPYIGVAHIAVASNGTAQFTGVIDEVAIYNTALSSGQISSHYGNGNAATSSSVPDLVISKSHVGTFTRGSNGGSYTITVSNVGLASTSGVVSVTDTLPNSLSVASFLAPGWTCNTATATCSRSDVLAAGSSYPAITMQVNISPTVPTSVTNLATVSGGGQSNTSNDTSSDVTSIVPLGACVVAPSGQLAWWAGDGAGADLIGSSTGTLQNGATIGQGLNGQAFQLNLPGPVNSPCPSCAFVGVNNSFPQLVGAVTVEAWINPSQAQVASGRIQWIYTQLGSVAGGFGSGGPQLGFSASDGIYWRPNSDVAGTFSIPGAIQANAWTHVAGTYDSSTGISRLFINGVQRATETVSGNVSLAPAAFLGKRLQQDYFSGTLDEVSLYNRALSLVEIQSIFNAGSSGKCKSQGSISTIVEILKNFNETHSLSDVVHIGDNPNDTQFLPPNPIGTTYTAQFNLLTPPTSGFAALKIDQYQADNTTPQNRSFVSVNGTAVGYFSLNSFITNLAGSTTLPVVTDSFPVPASLLRSGTNTLIVHAGNQGGFDDFSVTNIRLQIPVPVAVANHSFESPALGIGGYNTFGPVTGWSITGETGVFNPEAFRYNAPPPEGIQVAFTNGGSLTQTLNETLQGRSSYMLTVEVGRRKDCCNFPGYTVALFAGDVLLGSESSLTPVAGAFLTSTVSYTSPASDPAAGQPLRIVLTGAGGAQTNFDNVRLVRLTSDVPDLMVSKTHAGNFQQGQVGATYTITVKNVGEKATAGQVTVTDALPAELTGAVLAGAGWTCPQGTLVCTRSDVLAAGSSYPPITLNVRVSATAPSSVTNRASVEGGGDTNPGNNVATDLTTITPTAGTPDLIISKSHSGNFTQGGTGSYAIQVSNVGNGPTAGTVAVTDSLPAGLSVVSIGGGGWTCNVAVASCSRSDSLAGGASYPVVTLTVNIGPNTQSPALNVATVSGGGDSNALNNVANDSTVIIPAVCINPPSGVVRWWSGDGNANDLVSGESGNAQGVTYIPGQVGQAFGLSGNGRVALGTGPAVLGTGPFTIEGWVRTSATSGVVIQQRDGNGFNGEYVMAVGGIGGGGFATSPGKLCWSTYGDNAFGLNFCSQRSVNDGAFHHVAVTRGLDGAGAIFIDGLLDSSQAAPPRTLAALGVFIGFDARDGGTGFNGAIDELSLYSRVLSAAEILVISNAAGSGKCKGSGNSADLSISKIHAGSFRAGGTGEYSITVRNVGNQQTNGQVSVVDNLPVGLSVVSTNGPGWTCTLSSSSARCSRSDPLAGGASYPALILTVAIAETVGSSVTNVANVEVNGDANQTNNSAADITVIEQQGGVVPNPGSINFGTVTVATVSRQSVTLTNTRTTNLTITAISASGAGFALESLPPMPITLAGGGTARFTVAFTPTSGSVFNGSVTIATNASSPGTVFLNGTGSAVPTAVVTVRTDQPIYHRASPVQISGRLVSTNGSGIGSATVLLTISLNGTARSIPAFTDSTGNYKAVFQPTASDGGNFTLTAIASAAGAFQPATTTFRILGILLSPNSVSQDLASGSSVALPLTVQNLSDGTLSNVSFTFSVTPTGAVGVAQTQAVGTLLPGISKVATITVTAPSGTPLSTPVKVTITATGVDQASGFSESSSSTAFITLRPAVSTPVMVPASASVGINPGKSITRTFRVRNDGYIPMTDARVTMEAPAGASWIALGNASLGTISPGGSAQFQLLVNPGSNVTVGSYPVKLTVSGGTAPLQANVAISVTQLLVGSAAFVVSDDIGSKVSGATVTMVGKTNGKSYQAVTDSTGSVTISGVDAGEYVYSVAADSHDSTNDTLSVTANSVTNASVILSYNVVTLSFIVIPTTIVDQYNVTLNVTYSTTLPKPALQVTPYSLDLSFLPEDAPEGKYKCSLNISNSHPTASVRNLVVDASGLDAGLPAGSRMLVFFPDGTQVYQVGTLAGKANLTVPCYAKLDSGTVASHSSGNIVARANYDYSLDGKILEGTTTTNVPVNYRRPNELLYDPVRFTYDMRTDPDNPVLRYEGGSLVFPVTSKRPVAMNLQKPANTPFSGRNLVAFIATQGGANVSDVIQLNSSNAIWRTDFDPGKQTLLGYGDSTTFDISAPDAGLSLEQVLAARIASNPSQVLNNPSYLAFQGKWADGAVSSPFLIPIQITTITPTSTSQPVGPSGGGGGGECPDLDAPECRDPILPVVLPGGSQNGTILLAFDQTIKLERQAYNAILGIGARTTLTNARASITIKDSAGNDASSKFFVLLTSDPRGATQGGTIVSSTSVAWQLIPSAGAGGTAVQGTKYNVQARFNYSVAGVAKSVDTQVVSITVLPAPKLMVAYSAPFVVMPGKEVKVRVTVQNVGYGVARNLSIQTMQPRIVESLPDSALGQLLGDPGPTVEFNVVGSSNTAANTGYTANALTIRFGDVAPGTSVSGYWSLRVSRKGFFIDISANMTHVDYRGIALDPLILPPTTSLVPAVGGTVTSGDGLPMAGLSVSLTQAGTAKGSDVTDAVGNYYVPDLTGGNYVGEVRDLAANVLASKPIGVLSDQGTNFVDFVVTVPSTVRTTVTSNPPGQTFAVDGKCYTTPQAFEWDFGTKHLVAFSPSTNAPGVAGFKNVFSRWNDGVLTSVREIAVGQTATTYTATFARQAGSALPPGTGSGIRITSPPEGATVVPGDTVTVVVVPDAGTVLQKMVAWIPPVSVIPQIIEGAPFQVGTKVPTGMVGPALIQVYALDTAGRTLQRTSTVLIESPAVPTALTAYPAQAVMSAAGRQIPAQMIVTLPDGTRQTTTLSGSAILASTNERVATVDPTGRIVAVAPGTCSVCASYRGLIATIPVRVGVFSTAGDFDGDADVDQDDLSFLLRALNSSSTGPGDPRDLNRDAVIDANDSRILTTLCTRARCAIR